MQTVNEFAYQFFDLQRQHKGKTKAKTNTIQRKYQMIMHAQVVKSAQLTDNSQVPQV
jgi:hypothetical protein